MASAFRKFGSFLGLVEDDYYEEEVAAAPARQASVRDLPVRTAQPTHRETSPRTFDSREMRASIHAVAPVSEESTSVANQIVNVAPRSFNEAKQIGEEFRAGHAVIMNLQEIDDETSRRLIDYASGLVHGLEGKMERVSHKVFVISPRNMDVRDLARMSTANDGFFNQS
jgi:cell division inhibitor SepF